MTGTVILCGGKRENRMKEKIGTVVFFLLLAVSAAAGILLTMIWAVPLSIAYIKTKNIYVVMTAHFIGSLLGNGFDIIFTAIQLI